MPVRSIRAFVLDVDRTLTRDPNSPLTPGNTLQLVRALTAGIPVLLIGGSPLSSQGTLASWNTRRSTGGSRALCDRVLVPLRKSLLAVRSVPALSHLTLQGLSGYEQATFSPLGTPSYRTRSNRRLGKSLQHALSLAMALGFLDVIPSRFQDRLSGLANRLRFSKTASEIWNHFNRAWLGLPDGSRVYFRCYGSELSITQERRVIVAGTQALASTRRRLQQAGISLAEKNLNAFGGKWYFKIGRMNKTLAVTDWLNRHPGQGLVVAVGDKPLDRFLWEVKIPSYCPFYLGQPESVPRSKRLRTFPRPPARPYHCTTRILRAFLDAYLGAGRPHAPITD